MNPEMNPDPLRIHRFRPSPLARRAAAAFAASFATLPRQRSRASPPSASTARPAES